MLPLAPLATPLREPYCFWKNSSQKNHYLLNVTQNFEFRLFRADSSDDETISLSNDIVSWLDRAQSMPADTENICPKLAYPTTTYPVPLDFQNNLGYANGFLGAGFDHSTYVPPCSNMYENQAREIIGHPENTQSLLVPNGDSYPVLPSFSSLLTNTVQEAVNDYPYAVS